MNLYRTIARYSECPIRSSLGNQSIPSALRTKVPAIIDQHGGYDSVTPLTGTSVPHVQHDSTSQNLFGRVGYTHPAQFALCILAAACRSLPRWCSHGGSYVLLWLLRVRRCLASEARLVFRRVSSIRRWGTLPWFCRVLRSIQQGVPIGRAAYRCRSTDRTRYWGMRAIGFPSPHRSSPVTSGHEGRGASLQEKSGSSSPDADGRVSHSSLQAHPDDDGAFSHASRETADVSGGPRPLPELSSASCPPQALSDHHNAEQHCDGAGRAAPSTEENRARTAYPRQETRLEFAAPPTAITTPTIETTWPSSGHQSMRIPVADYSRSTSVLTLGSGAAIDFARWVEERDREASITSSMPWSTWRVEEAA